MSTQVANPNTPSTSTAEAENKTPTRSATVAGRQLTFAEHTITRGKGTKGRVYWSFQFKDGKGYPDMGEIAALVAALGQEPMLKIFALDLQQLARKASLEANVETKNEDGSVTFTVDTGKVQKTLVDLAVNWTAQQAAMSELKAQEDKLSGEFNALMAKILTMTGKNQPVPMELQNQAQQLLLKLNDLRNAAKKRSRKGKKEAAATTPAAPTTAVG